MSSAYMRAQISRTFHQSSDMEEEIETEGNQPLQNCPNLMLLHCLFAMVFAAAILGLLNCLGFVVRSSTCCPTSNGYSMCEVYQDLRSVLSFLLGALLCCLLTSQEKGQGETADDFSSGCKAQLYTCLL
eukprot:TRINITY_DN45004_c0_g1_i1.p1 TRINITY_DN45004_c0_g1~~TRINITY_DN45004_c0_g1_i1.p1  ORF type:complete len:129 (-),score=24.75 TRINITY_DN45004_c0_g1_i1:89-475(-)